MLNCDLNENYSTKNCYDLQAVLLIISLEVFLFDEVKCYYIVVKILLKKKKR